MKNMEKKEAVWIVYAVDNYYIQFLAVSIRSILYHREPSREYQIYILYDQLEGDKIVRVLELSEPGVEIEFMQIGKKYQILLKDLPVSQRFPATIYYRLLIPMIWEDKRKILYFDCDTIALSDVGQLYDTRLESCTIAAVRNASNEFRNTYVTGNLRIRTDEYINSGVLLINIKEFLLKGTFTQVQKVLLEIPGMDCPDQDALSIVCRGQILFLDSMWNIQWQKIENINKCGVVHYNGVYKPWMEPTREYAQYFWKFAWETPFKDDLLRLRSRQLEERTQPQTVSLAEYQRLLCENENLRFLAWRLEQVEQSASYHLGLAVTKVPRKIKNLLYNWKKKEYLDKFQNECPTETGCFLRIDYIMIQNGILMIDGYVFRQKEEQPQRRVWYERNLKQEHKRIIKITAEEIDSETEMITLGKFAPVNGNNPNSYVYLEEWIVSQEDGYLVCQAIAVASGNAPIEKNLAIYEQEYVNELNQLPGENVFRALEYRNTYFKLVQEKTKQIWLVMDRPDRADDNGEVFYRYAIGRQHPAISIYFIIKKESPDYKRLVSYGGDVVDYKSEQHINLRLLADYVISSEMSDGVLEEEQEYLQDILNKTKYVFLQHGIINADFKGQDIGKYIRNYSGFIASTKMEYQYLLSEKFYYNQSEVWLTGLPRYDELYSDTRKVITVMPTWRKELCLYRYDIYSRKMKWLLKDDYKDSSYFHFYNNLMQHQGLLEAARQYGYKLCFLSHPLLQPYQNLLEPASDWNMLDQNNRYREIFARSALLVTDYSSAAFDFSYLKKPVIYSQFDREAFWTGHTYTKGYFDYYKDGFGEVEETLEGTVERMVEYMERDCELKKQYREQIEAFFHYWDGKNSQRVYEKILDLEG